MMAQQGRELAERIVADWVKFWNNYDLDQVDRLFLTNAHVSYFSSEKQGVVKGIDAMRRHHEGFGFVKGGKKSANRLWLDDLDADVFGTTTVVTAIWHFQRENADKVQKGPVTLVYVQDGGSHRIAHGHFANY
jgi:ketosteroid isomerase-like protein